MILDTVDKSKKPVLDKNIEIVYYVYILLLSNGHFYTGYTVDVEKRIRCHLKGKGSKCVRSFIPECIECVWKCKEKSAALKAEAYIKSLTRKEKESLIALPGVLNKIFKKKGYEIKECRKYYGKRISVGTV